MTREELLALLLVERFGPSPVRRRTGDPSVTAERDDPVVQRERRRTLDAAVTLTESRRALLREW